ncbi:MAG: DUF3179 domain-containing protein [Ignavibacteriae bacterium]|nr:DUF3179 domain-containing protein [Ignavibacteriota bacterium]
MKNKTRFLLLPFLILNNMFLAQDGLENILKVYPKWTTNFEKKSIDLSELFPGGPPKDGIPAIVNPKFTTILVASEWLAENEPVIYVKIDGIAKAYPLQILMFHEIVNDKIGDVPVLVSFCPLCYSGIVYNRTLNGLDVNFGVSGLLRNSDLVMYDQLSESFWQQFTGEAIVGEMLGQKLDVIQSQIISFKDFALSNPNGIVLSKETCFERPYGKNPYVGYDYESTIPLLFRGKKDNRLSQNEKVIGIRLDDFSKAYPYSITSEQNIIYDKIDDMKIVIFHLPGTASSMDDRLIKDSKDVGATGVFIPQIGSLELTFYFADEKLIDKQTKSIWNITGKSISGKLKGKQLNPIPHGDYFAFAWLAFRPNSLIYTSSE